MVPGEYFHKTCLSYVLSVWDAERYTDDRRRLEKVFKDMPALLESRLFTKLEEHRSEQTLKLCVQQYRRLIAFKIAVAKNKIQPSAYLQINPPFD